MDEAPAPPPTTPMEGRDRFYLWFAAAFGAMSFILFLGWHNTVDNDMWAKLAIGASVWLRGVIPQQDMFAFTPVLDRYMDHEWGAGVWYYTLLKFIGPRGLMLHKLVTATGAVTLAAVVALRLGAAAPVLLLWLIPGALCIAPGYVPVVRSHSFTYLFFAATLFLLESMRRGARWPVWVFAPLYGVWVNVHGGFVAGLGLMGIYAAAALFEKGPWKLMGVALAAASVATLANPWGVYYWPPHLKAVFMERPNIAEWLPLPVFRNDSFIGFRILFVLAIPALALGWKSVARHSPGGLAMLALTAYLGWSVQRHVPFFGIMATGIVAPYAAAALGRGPEFLRRLTTDHAGGLAAFCVHGLLAMYIVLTFAPYVTFRPISPVGTYPVREVDVLMYSGAKGNVAVPFRWGSYTMWRLHPNNLISIDGRYEAAYPHETFDISLDFHFLRGERWPRLIEEYDIPFVILDLQTGQLRPEHLAPFGYVLAFQFEQDSALLARRDRLDELIPTLQQLPDTIQPLDAEIPMRWWQAGKE